MKKVDIKKTLGYYVVMGSFEAGQMFRLRSKVYSYIDYVLDDGNAIVVAKDCFASKYVALPITAYKNVEVVLM